MFFFEFVTFFDVYGFSICVMGGVKLQARQTVQPFSRKLQKTREAPQWADKKVVRLRHAAHHQNRRELRSTKNFSLFDLVQPFSSYSLKSGPCVRFSSIFYLEN